MEKILIIGDVHLGKGLALGKTSLGNLNSRILDQSKLLDWILEIAEENLITTLIFTGDIFEDSKPDYRVFDIFSIFLRQAQYLNLEVHLVLGNHELKRTGGQIFSSLQVLSQIYEHVFYHSTINTIHKEGLSITFFPFTDRRILQAANHQEAIKILSSHLPYQLGNSPLGNTKILIGHLALEGSIYVGDEIDDQSNELHCPLNMFSSYDYVWMGHIHKPQIRQKEPNFIAHIGSLDLSDFGEIDHQKQIVFFDVEQNKFEFITVPSRPLREFCCHFNSEIEDIPKYVREKFAEIEKIKTWKSSILKMNLSFTVPCSDELRVELKKIPFEFGICHLAYFLETIKAQKISENKDDSQNEGLALLTPEAAIKQFTQTLSLSEEQKAKFLNIALSAVKEISQ